ncbi:MAG: site-specific integrase [Candidatus Thiodiazotropha sp.]
MTHEIPPSKGSLGSPSGSPKTEFIIFTDKGIQALKPTKSRRVVWAKGLKGLGLRITPKGTKSFIYKYDLDGKDRWLTLGRYPKLKLAEALKKYGEALEQVEVGEDPAEENVQINIRNRTALTVSQLADEYIKKYAKPRKRSWKEDERILNHDVLHRWGTTKASKITRRNVLDLLDDIVSRGSPVQANRTLAVIRRMFNFAIDRDVIETSPCFRVKPPSPEQHKDRYLSLNEKKTFWNKLETAPLSKQTVQVLKLLLLTLQRNSEVISINRSELDLKAGTWTIPAAKTKNKRAHLVALSPLALEIIKEALKTADKEGFLFPGDGPSPHITNSAISRAIARNLDHLGLEKFTPHDLRRTGSTQLAAFKVPRFDRERILNHTDQTIGAVYDIHEYEDEKHAAMNLWSDIILKTVNTSEKVDMKELRSTLKYQNYFPD